MLTASEPSLLPLRRVGDRFERDAATALTHGAIMMLEYRRAGRPSKNAGGPVHRRCRRSQLKPAKTRNGRYSTHFTQGSSSHTPLA